MIKKSTSTKISNRFTKTMVTLIIITAILITMATLMAGFINLYLLPKTSALAFFNERTFDPLDAIRNLLPISIVLILIISGTFIWLNRLITTLTTGINQVANGDFTVSLNPKKGGPLADTYRDFNQMTSELNKTANLRDDFINQFSHEFRTPITSIQGFTDLMLHKELPKDKQLAYLKLINQEAKRLTNLSNNVLNLTKLEAQQIVKHPVTFDLAEQVRQAVILLLPQLDAKQITPTIDINSAKFNGDPDLLQQVWVNLLNNACRFTPEQGKLTISVQADFEKLQISFTNNGPLISANQVPHLFDKFYQSPDTLNNHGLGLGLTIAQRIVELHHGSISVVSNPTIGTRFTVQLPNNTSS